MELKDSRDVPKHGYHNRGVPKQYFHLYLKEIELKFNYRDENLYPVLTKIVVGTAPDLRYYLLFWCRRGILVHQRNHVICQELSFLSVCQMVVLPVTIPSHVFWYGRRHTL